jgi:hypothetical protein
MNKLYQYSHIFLFLCSSLTVVTAQRTICASGVTINATNYNLKGVSGTEVFPGAPYLGTGVTDLGLLTALSISFARHDINRSVDCTTGSVDNLLYRVYKVGSTPPAFTTAALAGGATEIGICTPPDNFHKKATLSVDLFPGGECGQYQVDFKNTTFASGMGCVDETATYSATFSVAGALTLTAESVTTSAACGDMVDVTIKISNSPCDLSGLQYSVNWDPKQFQYVTNVPVDVDGQTPFRGLSETAMGKLTYSWADNTNPCNTVLSDGTLLPLPLPSRRWAVMPSMLR